MDIHQVALKIFAGLIEKPTGVSGPLGPNEIHRLAERAYVIATEFMKVAEKHKPAPGKATVTPLKT